MGQPRADERRVGEAPGSTGNLKLVQRAVNHSDIKTATKYTAVYDDDVAAALAAVGKSRREHRSDDKDAA